MRWESGERDLDHRREDDAEEDATAVGATGKKWKKTTKEASGKRGKRSGAAAVGSQMIRIVVTSSSCSDGVEKGSQQQLCVTMCFYAVESQMCVRALKCAKSYGIERNPEERERSYAEVGKLKDQYHNLRS